MVFKKKKELERKQDLNGSCKVGNWEIYRLQVMKNVVIYLTTKYLEKQMANQLSLILSAPYILIPSKLITW